MSEQTAHARRSTLLLAASSGVSFVLGVARTKLLALAWGPGGVGHIGLMQAAMGTATLATGLGVDGLIPREVAAERARGGDANRAVHTATVGASLLAVASTLISAIGLWIYFSRIGVGGGAAAVVLGAGAGLSVLGANFRALLSGLGAVRELATASIVAAALALVVSGALALVSASGIAIAMAVAAVPLTTLLTLSWFVRSRRTTGAELAVGARGVLAIARRAGIFTVAGVLPLLGQTFTRTLAATSMSEDRLGEFQAAAAVAAISTSVLASSIGPVLFPQLSQKLAAGESFSEMLGAHAGFLLSLYAPVAIVAIAVPDVALRLLYSGRFEGAADQLAWQIIGELFRLPVWLMATTLVMKERGRAYLLLELTGVATQVIGLYLVLPEASSAQLGWVFATASAVQFTLACALLGLDGFRWPRRTVLHLLAIVALGAGLATARGAPHVTLLAALALLPLGWKALSLVRGLRAR